MSAPPPRLAWWRRLVLPAGAAVAAAAVAGFVAWTMKPDVASRPIARFAITLSADEEFSPAQATRNVIAVSPDGSRIAYMANGRLYLHTRDRLDSTVIAENGAMPFFSPDGQSVGFWHEGQLRRVSVKWWCGRPYIDRAVHLGSNLGTRRHDPVWTGTRRDLASTGVRGQT